MRVLESRRLMKVSQLSIIVLGGETVRPTGTPVIVFRDRFDIHPMASQRSPSRPIHKHG